MLQIPNSPTSAGAGIVGDGGRPEIFVPDSPGYILPDASAALRKLQDSMGGGAGRGRSIVYSPTIHHHGDINDRADRAYFEKRERDIVQDVLLGRGG